jgi:hypothetical protein
LKPDLETIWPNCYDASSPSSTAVAEAQVQQSRYWKCSSGRFGSCFEAIKGEAITELAAFQKGLRIVKVAPQSLKKTLGCAAE